MPRIVFPWLSVASISFGILLESTLSLPMTESPPNEAVYFAPSIIILASLILSLRQFLGPGFTRHYDIAAGEFLQFLFGSVVFDISGDQQADRQGHQCVDSHDNLRKKQGNQELLVYSEKGTSREGAETGRLVFSSGMGFERYCCPAWCWSSSPSRSCFSPASTSSICGSVIWEPVSLCRSWTAC